jgi:hypothetical protein
MKAPRLPPIVLLVASISGLALFARGVRLVDTLGMFVCGALAGGALAALARRP